MIQAVRESWRDMLRHPRHRAETYRVRLDDLGNPNAVPVAKDVYDRLRERNLSDTKAARATA